jgi:hypothetical protein
MKVQKVLKKKKLNKWLNLITDYEDIHYSIPENEVKKTLLEIQFKIKINLQNSEVGIFYTIVILIKD